MVTLESDTDTTAVRSVYKAKDNYMGIKRVILLWSSRFLVIVLLTGSPFPPMVSGYTWWVY